MAKNQDLRDQIDQLTAERDALQVQVRLLATRPERGTRLRALAVGLLIALACVSFTSATVGVWAKRSVMNNEVWMKRVGPLGRDPAVHKALADWMTAQLMDVIDPSRMFEEVLPEKGRILAVPLENAVGGFVNDRIIRFMETDAFADLWVVAANRAHDQLVDIVRGRSQVIMGEADQIVINFIPLINEMLAQLSELTPQLFGRTIQLPKLSVDQLPENAQKALLDALGLPVTGDFGIIRIDDGGQLHEIQRVVRFSQAAVWALIAITVATMISALALSTQRRRTILQIAGGLAVGMVVVRRGGMLVSRELRDMIIDPTVRAAGTSVIKQFVDPLISTATTVLWVLAIVVALALITGPYKWASRLRPRIKEIGATAAGKAIETGSRVTDEKNIAWMRANHGALQIGGVVAFVALLMLTNLGWFGTGVLLAFFAAYQAAAWWLGESAKRMSIAIEPNEPPTDPEP